MNPRYTQFTYKARRQTPKPVIHQQAKADQTGPRHSLNGRTICGQLQTQYSTSLPITLFLGSDLPPPPTLHQTENTPFTSTEPSYSGHIGEGELDLEELLLNTMELIRILTNLLREETIDRENLAPFFFQLNGEEMEIDQRK